MKAPSRYQPIYWEPAERFDWQTGGRALSEAEIKVLRRLLDDDEENRRLRNATLRREQQFFNQE